MTTSVKYIDHPKTSGAPSAASPTTTASKAAGGQSAQAEGSLNLPGEDRRQLIAEAAYFRAERRGFHPGAELDDWLAAEIEIDALLGADDARM